MGQFNLWTYVSITDIVEVPLIEILHATWHSILFLCSSNYPFNFLLLICINPPQSVFLPDCLYIFQKPFNYLLILLFTYYITTLDLYNPPPCLDLAEMNFSCRLSSLQIISQIISQCSSVVSSLHWRTPKQNLFGNATQIQMFQQWKESVILETIKTCWLVSIQVMINQT